LQAASAEGADASVQKASDINDLTEAVRSYTQRVDRSRHYRALSRRTPA